MLLGEELKQLIFKKITFTNNVCIFVIFQKDVILEMCLNPNDLHHGKPRQMKRRAKKEGSW
jgi:hypothetical protein